MHKLILNLIFLILSFHIPAQNNILRINNISHQSVTPYLSFFNDSSRKMPLHEIINLAADDYFKPVKGNFFTHPAGENVFWFKFSVSNPFDHPFWHLDISYAPFDRVIIYLQKKTGQIDTIKQDGVFVPGTSFLQDRTAVHGNLLLDKDETYTVFIKVESTAYILLPVYIRSTEDMINRSVEKNRVLFSLLALITFTALFNLLLFFKTRDKTYLLLSLVFFLIVITAAYQYGIDIIPSLHPYLKSEARVLALWSTLLVFNLFSVRYLEAYRKRSLMQVFNIISIVCIAFIISTLLPFIPQFPINLITPYANFFIIVVYLFIGLHCIKNINKHAYYFFFYNLVFVISSLVWLLLINNLLQYSLTANYISLISISFSGLLLSFGVSDKISELKKEKEKNVQIEILNQQLKQEISERKATENNLRTSEEKFRLFFELSPQPILFTDYYTGEIEEFNNKLIEITGFSEQDLKDHTTLGLKMVDEEIRRKILSDIEEKGEANGIELSFQTPAKGRMHFLLFAKSLQLKDSLKLFTILLDITPIKKSQLEIKKLSTAIDQAANSIIITDANGTIEYVNQYFTELTGYTADEVIGKKPDILKSGYHNSLHYKELWDTIKDGRIWTGEFCNLTKKGDRYWEASAITPIVDDKGNITHFVAIKQNITESKMQVEALQQSEHRLRELNATKDKFFSIIGHDLMDPFNALIGFTDMLVESLKGKNYHDSLEYAGVIHQSSKRILDLLQNLLIWSRAQSGKIEIKPHLTDLNSMIAEILLVLNYMAQNKEIEVKTELEGNTKIMADYNMINTVIRNLLMNAIKFTGTGGSILIKTTKSDNHLIFSIKDTGCGIYQNNLDNLFRLDRTFSRRGYSEERGTGLGLLICKEFIDIHKGEIWAESTPGIGSTFYFRIPDGINPPISNVSN